MPENIQKDEKIEISYSIHFKEFPKELITIIQDHNIECQIWKTLELKKKELDNDFLFVEIEPELYQKLQKLSEITGIPIKDIVSKEMGDFFFSVGDIPVIFLDHHLGIEKIENPIEMLNKISPIINIRESYLRSLKTKEDLIKEIDKWNNPLKFQ